MINECLCISEKIISASTDLDQKKWRRYHLFLLDIPAHLFLDLLPFPWLCLTVNKKASSTILTTLSAINPQP